MTSKEKYMRPVWYFVGWILMLIGGIVTAAGIWNFYSEVSTATVVKRLHPDIWWGAALVVVGIVYIWVNKNVRV